MFATQTNKNTKSAVKGNSQRADSAAGKDSPELNPVWQSLALRPFAIQPKLTIGQPSDAYEQEADHIADRVMRMPGVPRSRDELSLSADSTAKARRKGDAREEEETQLQRKEANGESRAMAPELIDQPLSSTGEPLDPATRDFFESRFGHDFSSVRVHTGRQASQSARAVNALAYTAGSDVVFGTAQYSPDTARGRRLLAHELTHVVQQAGTAANGTAPATIQRKEVEKDNNIQGTQDWTTKDRESNTKRWQDACLTNLIAIDSSQYVKVVERRDFYKWFYEYATSLGYTTRWALAAYIVANGAHQIADMDVEHELANAVLDIASVELQGAMREGNQVIFDNVLPKLKKLIEGGPIKGPAALKWDMQVLAEEQTLIQAMYSKMSKETVDQLDYIARRKRFAGWGASLKDLTVAPGAYNKTGIVPAFDQSDITDIGDRWKYGMDLGNQFAPSGTGFDPKKDAMPAVSADYKSGSEFAKVDTQANLHQLDAWLNPERFARTGPGSDLNAIISKLSAFEKLKVLSDRSADGWAYSTQFARFGFITEAMVKQALPVISTPVIVAQVAAFMARYKAERTLVEQKYSITIRHD